MLIVSRQALSTVDLICVSLIERHEICQCDLSKSDETADLQQRQRQSTKRFGYKTRRFDTRFVARRQSRSLQQELRSIEIIEGQDLVGCGTKSLHRSDATAGNEHRTIQTIRPGLTNDLKVISVVEDQKPFRI